MTIVLWVLCTVGVYVFVEKNRRVLRGVASYFIRVPDFLPSGGGCPVQPQMLESKGH